MFFILPIVLVHLPKNLWLTLQNSLTLDSTINGIHAHNNQFLALQNTIDAYQSGFSYLDATIMGMGRGPGNAFTENLIAEITTLLPDSKYNLYPYCCSLIIICYPSWMSLNGVLMSFNI